MKLNYNVTGTQRKALVAAISEALNSPVKYLGAPSFAYQVGGYHIDKNGILTSEDNLDLEDALYQKGFEADGDTREYDEPDTYESGLGGMGAIPTFEDLRMDEHEELGLGRTRRENFQCENGMQASDVPESNEGIGLVIEIPKEGISVQNLQKLIASKESLIKKALGTEYLTVIVGKETLSFPWFKEPLDGETVKAYTMFISAMCKMVKTQRRITATDKPVTNEKFAFRCFLLRLGFIGAAFKNERKILLSKLSGSSAYKSGGASNE